MDPQLEIHRRTRKRLPPTKPETFRPCRAAGFRRDRARKSGWRPTDDFAVSEATSPPLASLTVCAVHGIPKNRVFRQVAIFGRWSVAAEQERDRRACVHGVSVPSWVVASSFGGILADRPRPRDCAPRWGVLYQRLPGFH